MTARDASAMTDPWFHLAIGDWEGLENSRLVHPRALITSISGLVAEYILATDVTRVRFPADAKTWSPQVKARGGLLWLREMRVP